MLACLHTFLCVCVYTHTHTHTFINIYKESEHYKALCQRVEKSSILKKGTIKHRFVCTTIIQTASEYLCIFSVLFQLPHLCPSLLLLHRAASSPYLAWAKQKYYLEHEKNILPSSCCPDSGVQTQTLLGPQQYRTAITKEVQIQIII